MLVGTGSVRCLWYILPRNVVVSVLRVGVLRFSGGTGSKGVSIPWYTLCFC